MNHRNQFGMRRTLTSMQGNRPSLRAKLSKSFGMIFLIVLSASLCVYCVVLYQRLAFAEGQLYHSHLISRDRSFAEPQSTGASNPAIKRPVPALPANAASQVVRNKADSEQKKPDNDLDKEEVRDGEITALPHTFYGTTSAGIARAFELLGWQRTKDPLEAGMLFVQSKKKLPPQELHYWQRANHFSAEHNMSSKTMLLKGLRRYARMHARDQPHAKTFIPEGYVLYDETDTANFLKNVDTSKPWVLKFLKKDNGKGITMIGPNSEPLMNLIKELKQQGNMPSHMIQEYIQHELTFRRYKFDLRCFVLFASIRPMLAYYGGGYLRVSHNIYDESDFSSTHKHLTNVGQNDNKSKTLKQLEDEKKEPKIEAVTSFEDWVPELQRYVTQERPDLFAADSPQRADPMLHIQSQIKHAISTAISAYYESIVKSDEHAENEFAWMGADFIIDENLKVWMTEMQTGPGMGHEEFIAKKNFSRKMVPTMIKLVEEVTNKQLLMLQGQKKAAIKSKRMDMTKNMKSSDFLPLENVGAFDLIATDQYSYRYELMPN